MNRIFIIVLNIFFRISLELKYIKVLDIKVVFLKFISFKNNTREEKNKIL